MNYIDITQCQKTSCVKNNTVVVTNREGIQGPPGEKGSTPYIDKITGNWCIAGMDTGVSAIGQAGNTPYINSDKIWCIGDINTGIVAEGNDGLTPEINPENFHWMIGTEDTGIIAKGQDGLTPHIGENGNWFLGTVDTGIQAGLGKDDVVQVLHFSSVTAFPLIGNAKDLYVDDKTNTIYRFDTKKIAYLSFSPDYSEDIDKILGAMNEADITIICGNSELTSTE